MGQSERSLISLGRRVAARQDEAPEARRDHARGRARLLQAELPARRGGLRLGSPGARRWPLGLAAALLVAALVALLRPREPLRFALGTIDPGAVGAWIAAPPGDELPIRFSDGSLLRLAPGGRARVAAVDADGAELALERGALDLAVVHRAGTRWRVRVGPFLVHVIGTRFETSWDPVTEQFGVALREGAITVSGPVVGDARAVHAGERLTVSPAKGTLEVSALDAVAPPPSAAPSAPALSVDPPAPLPPARPSAAEPAPPRTAPAPHPSAPGWRALARDAKYKDALAAAELEGFDTLCAAASASDLRALGDAARLGGSPARAAQALAAVRARFPGSPEAAAAAFILGRIAQDRSRDPAGAAAWFTRYLSEQPGGELAAEAAGRLVEARDAMDDDAGARAAAERYLAAYPNGSHAGYARGVLARGARPAP